MKPLDNVYNMDMPSSGSPSQGDDFNAVGSNTIVYPVGAGLYINITNRCPCDCVFCIRKLSEGMNPGESLWLNHEPSIGEIKEAIGQVDFKQFDEVVFCGYGEPTERLEELVETAKYIRGLTHLPIRLNTNGLSDLINERKTAQLIAGYIDRVSISLNAPDPETYVRLCSPVFGEAAYFAMLQFAKESIGYINDVTLSVVDGLSSGQIEECKAICHKMGAKFRIRG